MKTRFRLLTLVGAMAFCGGVAFGGVEMQQQIQLVEGWNSIHVQVAETNDVDTLFRDWPVEWVALYDPAAFLETRQYSAESSNEGTSRAGYKMWRRGEPGLSGFRYVPADSVLVCFVTNGMYSCSLYGEPCAPRITWHKSDKTNDLNLVGFSTWGDATTRNYFSGLDVGDASFFIFGGPDAGKPMVIPTTIAGATTFTNGQVFAVSSTKVSDWSGVLYVSPRNGIDFGADGTKGTLEIRNDGATNRTVTIRMSAGSPRLATEIVPVPQGLWARDSRTASTNGPWTAFGVDRTLSRDLAAGETWSVVIAVDRSKLSGDGAGPVGTEYGAILSIHDADGGSKMRVDVPIKATSAGDQSEFAWPKGVWVASAELDTVNFMLTEANGGGAAADEGDQPAGGKMKVRLPLYVDELGKMTLLQRFWYGRDTNGVLRAYSGAVKTSDVPLYDVKRVSSACLPADQPVLGTTANGVFGQEKARFGFTVGETSYVNPMRHAQHPQHDGLKADYSGPTPSGDSFMNYAQTVKPEAFSVTNLVELTWEKTSAAAWNPEETLTGDLKWEFHGIRHERPIQAQGRFSMKRLSPVSMKME